MKAFLWTMGILGTAMIFGYLNNFKEVITPVILFWTFLAIVWYAKETQNLKEATIKRPILSFQKGYNLQYARVSIELKNYGEGVARNVEIKLGTKVIHKIPLVSSIYSKHNQPLPFSEVAYLLLEEWKDEINISYYDVSGETKYTTIVQWDDSEENRDKCKIIKYYYRTS